MTESEELARQAAELRTKATKLGDKSALEIMAAVAISAVGSFAGVLVLMNWYIEKAMGGNDAPVAALAAYGGMAAVGATIVGLLVTAFWHTARGTSKRKESAKLVAESHIMAAEEARVAEIALAAGAELEAHLVRQDAAQREKATADHQKAAAEASDARETQARAEQAARVAESIHDRNELLDKSRSTQTQNPGYGRSEGQNRPGSSPTQGKGRSPRRDA
jgi:hypothetical protein